MDLLKAMNDFLAHNDELRKKYEEQKAEKSGFKDFTLNELMDALQGGQTLPQFVKSRRPLAEGKSLTQFMGGQTSEEAEAGQQGLMERATPPTSIIDKLLNPQRGTLPMFLLPDDQKQAFLSEMGMAIAGMMGPVGKGEALKHLQKLRELEKNLPPLQKSRELILKAFDKLWEQMDKVKK